MDAGVARRRRGPWIAGGIGVVVVAGALLWWALAVPALVKYPADVDTSPEYEGTFSLYVSPGSFAPLDQPMELPLTVERSIVGDPDESSSKLAVVDEHIEMKAGDLVNTAQHNRYVFDRRTMENVDDPRAFAFEPDNQVNRDGALRLQFPFGTDADDTYTVYKNEIAGTYEVQAVDGDRTYDTEGLTLTKFAAASDARPLSPVYLAGLRKAAPLPESLTLDQLKPSLAKAGVDVDALVAALAPALTAEDRAALGEIATQPIPLEYALAFSGDIGLETTTGSQVDVAVNETLGVRPAAAATERLAALLAKYAPTVPAAAQAEEAIAKLAAAPIPVFSYSYEQTPASVAEVADKVKDQRRMVMLAEQWIPWGLVGLGIALLLVAGITGFRGGGRRAVVAGRPVPKHA